MNLDALIDKIEGELGGSTNLMIASGHFGPKQLELIDALYKLETIKHLRESKSADKKS